MNVNDFQEQRECIYKDEQYAVRDNGAIYRYAREGKRFRKDDETWTFGKANPQNQYLLLGTERIHRIIALAFHGEPPSEQHVVDHIDTNRQNNRPENLRWLTKLENALNNPITRKRIIYCCGSIEEFLENPHLLSSKDSYNDISWMRTVSIEEAKISKERLMAWAESDKTPSGGRLGEWIYDTSNNIETNENTPEYIPSETKGAVQLNWKIPATFPYCPNIEEDEPIIAYCKNLQIDSIFCYNKLSTSILKKFILVESNTIYIITKSKDKEAIKQWFLLKVTFENELFIHHNLGSFFTEQGVEKRYTIVQGLEWLGEDSIDDYA